LLEPLEQRALDVEPLDDGLDHEIDIGDLAEIVLEISDRHEDRVARMRERRGLRLERLRERAGGDRIAIALRRDDIEQDDGDAGVGAMSRDAAAHHAGSEHGNATDRKCHGGDHTPRPVKRASPSGSLPRATRAAKTGRDRSASAAWWDRMQIEAASPARCVPWVTLRADTLFSD